MEAYATAVACGSDGAWASPEVAQLASQLGCDAELLRAIALGEVETDGISVVYPTGGRWFPRSLAQVVQLNAAVEAAGGVDAYREVEYQQLTSERLQRAQKALLDPTRPMKKVRPNVVYWLYDESDRLVYIGSTRDLDGRLRAHRKRWGDFFTRYEVTEHPSVEVMLQAERAAIAEHMPPLNVAGVG